MKIDVLDKGFVRLVSTTGSDQSITDCARTSYQKGTKKTSKDKTLIRYLMRHRHSSPTEAVTFTFHVKMPLFVRDQWSRHRSGRFSWIFSSMNWESLRYSDAKEVFYYPSQLSLQSASNKQGSEGYMDDSTESLEALRAHTEAGYKLYEELLEQGVAREQARMLLGQNLYTEGYWTISLHNLFHFMGLRSDPHAQYEIRVYSEAIEELVKDVVPFAYEAWVDYQKEACSVSRMEKEFLQDLLADRDDLDVLLRDKTSLGKRERAEFIAKFKSTKEEE